MTVEELIAWLKTEQHVFMLNAQSKQIIIDALEHYKKENDKINQPDSGLR